MSWLARLRRASWITDDSRRHEEDFSTDHGRIRHDQLQKGRRIPFSPVDPRVGSVICSRVRRNFGATQSRLVRRGKGADEYSLTSPLPRLRTRFMPESGSSGHVLLVLDWASLASGNFRSQVFRDHLTSGSSTEDDLFLQHCDEPTAGTFSKVCDCICL